MRTAIPATHRRIRRHHQRPRKRAKPPLAHRVRVPRPRVRPGPGPSPRVWERGGRAPRDGDLPRAAVWAHGQRELQVALLQPWQLELGDEHVRARVVVHVGADREVFRR